MSDQEELRVVTSITATDFAVKCPHCDEVVDGWLGSPRGQETECDYCHLPFKVHPDADIEIY